MRKRIVSSNSNFASLLVVVLALTLILSNVGFYTFALSEEKAESTSDGINWSWDRILQSGKPIVSNGNIYPPSPNESSLDCFILVSRNQIMWHCPDGDEHNYNRTILYRREARFRGAFSAPGTDRRRLWVLDSRPDYDLLLELDTVDGDILQMLEVEGTCDGHDTVRVENRIFMADTRNGHIVEFELPASAPPYTESSVKEGKATVVKEEGYVNIVKRHTGFTRADHVNNVAVHPDVLIASLHGGNAIKFGDGTDTNRPTRHSALSRMVPEEEGRELSLEKDGFSPITNMGTWCHGIAFWKDESTSDIKLISLDSKTGSLVSVVVSGANEGQRNVIWEPDLTHPVLVPPEGVARAYDNGAGIFGKGLALQGDVAFFGASYAREPDLRQTVPELLLVAVDLQSSEELWVRTIRSNGLVEQILTKSYLGWQMQLPAELTSVEITYHGGGGSMVEVCDNDIEDGSTFCKEYEEDYEYCEEPSADAMEAREVCCACDGGETYEMPLMAGTLDAEIMQLDEGVTATSTFVQSTQCLDSTGTTKHMPLEMKQMDEVETISNFDRDLKYIVKHICNIDVGPIQKRLMGLGTADKFDELFTGESQQRNGNAILKQRPFEMMQFVFSSREVDKVYHFPWLDDWLPVLEESVLEPLGLPLGRIIRMMFANMSKDSTTDFHQDINPWAHKAHRVHVPIITHPDVFFLTEVISHDPEHDEEEQLILRIKSEVGEIYEVNNALAHAVRNLGGSCVHLIIDWIEESHEGNSSLVKLSPGDLCDHPTGSNDLVCENENRKEREEL